MEKKIRLIIVGLIAFFLISIVYSFYLLNSREALKKDYVSMKESLVRENEEMAKKANAALQEKRNMESRFEDVKAQLDRISGERQELQSRYESLVREKDDLAEQLKRKPAPAPIIQAVAPVTPSYSESVSTEGNESYWAGVLMQKKELEASLEAAHNELEALKLGDEQAQRDKSVLQMEINNLNRENQDLMRQIEFKQKAADSKFGLKQKETETKYALLQSIIDNLGAELVRERNDKFKIQENLLPVKEENSMLRRQLKVLNERRAKLETKLAALEQKNASLAKKVSTLGVSVREKGLAFDILKNDLAVEEKAPEAVRPETAAKDKPVELPPIVVRSAPQVEAPQPAGKKSIAGKVAAVNRNSNFIVLDLGQDSGIKIGDVFGIYRENRQIATVQVIQTRKAISACDIQNETTAIRVGDIVR